MRKTQTMKPLFIPLMGVYYDQFAAGTKNREYRPYGPRWNFETCVVGRMAVISRGYGKQNRMTKMIINRSIVSPTPNGLAYIPVRPVCFSEGELQVSYFYKCLNAIPEEHRTAADLKVCDDTSIVQASTQCASMGLQP